MGSSDRASVVFKKNEELRLAEHEDSTQIGASDTLAGSLVEYPHLPIYPAILAVGLLICAGGEQGIYDRATFTMSMIPKARAETQDMSGRVFEVSRKQGGRWKISASNGQ